MEDHVQGDTSRWPKPPVDFKNKSSVLAWLGLPRIAQAKAELLFRSQREVRHKLNGHQAMGKHAFHSPEVRRRWISRTRDPRETRRRPPV